MPKKPVEMPKFKNESDEADWWASRAGRAYVQRKSREAQAKGIKFAGSPLVAELNKKNSTQIALRLPEPDIKQARILAARKGIGYQTFLKMLVHEGLEREAQRS
jgi:predicted DNA binding CopG/RHH family protein